MYKYLKNLFPGTSGLISMKLCMKHQRFIIFCSNDNRRTKRLIIFCSNDNQSLRDSLYFVQLITLVLILILFTARSNFATLAFIWENMTMMDTLAIIASCDLKFGLLCKLDD